VKTLANALLLLACLACLASRPVSAADALSPGDSVIVREGVTIALHVPPATNPPPASLGLLVCFGGQGDSVQGYPRLLAPLADALDLIVIVPRLPWFAQRGEVGVDGVIVALNVLRRELQEQLGADPGLVVVTGVSAGGAGACLLAKRWRHTVPLLVLHSTWRCVKEPAARTVLLVGEAETGFLGDAASAGPVLGKGTVDLFAVPGAGHQVHLAQMRAWLETELSAWRLARVPAALRAAGDHPVQRASVERTTATATRLLNTTLPEPDDFFRYQNHRRAELRPRFPATAPARSN